MLQAAACALLVLAPSWPSALVAGLLLGAGYGAYTSVDQALVTQVLPDERTIADYEEKRAALLARADWYESIREKPAVTLDGTAIRLLGNIVAAALGEASKFLKDTRAG